MNTLLPISTVRAQLPELVSQISAANERVTVTVHGKPKVVILSQDELDSLEETAEILSIPNIVKDIKASEKQIKKGQFIRLEDLKI